MQLGFICENCRVLPPVVQIDRIEIQKSVYVFLICRLKIKRWQESFCLRLRPPFNIQSNLQRIFFFYLLRPMQYKCKIYFPSSVLPLAVLDNKNILFALACFHTAHNYTKICLLTDRLLLRFRFRYPQD